jgi:uncharacterized protein (DUF2336 family)
MIVRHFLQWVRTASAAARADATSALARAYLYSDLSPDDRAAAEGALILLLDDASPLVRRAMAEVLAASADAPAAVVLALAGDRPDIATPVLARSPLLLDADLVDFVGGGEPAVQMAIAGRAALPCAVAAAIAEVGRAEACLVLIENADALIAPFSLERIMMRHGHLGAIREALLARDDLPVPVRQQLLVMLSDALAGFVAARRWLQDKRAKEIVREACEKATVTLAASVAEPELGPLIRHLRQSGQLTAGLVLRALLSGNTLLFEQALAELADMPLSRVAGLVHDRSGRGLRALFERAGFPAATYPAARAAIEALREVGYAGEFGGAIRLKRRMVERVLTQCGDDRGAEAEPLLILLRRFALEAAREEARLFCDELAAA